MAKRQTTRRPAGQDPPFSDHELRQQIVDNPDAAPELDEDWFRQAKVLLPERKQSISLRVDREVLDFFKSRPGRYQTLMNAVLRSYVKHHSGLSLRERLEQGDLVAKRRKVGKAAKRGKTSKAPA